MKRISTTAVCLCAATVLAACAAQMVHEDVKKHCAGQGKQAFIVTTERQGVPLLIESASAMYYCYGRDEVRSMPAGFGVDVIEGSELKGVGVVAVAPGSVADKAGVKVGDIVYEFSDHAVSRADELQAAIESTGQGIPVPIKLRRNKTVVAATAQF